MRILVMGVSGAGKSTIGSRLADRLGLPFVEGDDFHPPANKAKLAAGIALTDADRAPWLQTIHDALVALPGGWVLACSALKRTYRDLLFAGLDDVHVVLLDAGERVIADRLEHRAGHFADPAILPSQFDALEPPQHAIIADATRPIDAVVAEIVEAVTPKAD